MHDALLSRRGGTDPAALYLDQERVPPLAELDDPRALYLDLMKRCVTNWIYADVELKPIRKRGLGRLWVRLLGGRGARLVRPRPVDPKLRIEGRDWPATAHTMVGLKRLDNVQRCVEQVIKDDVPGDLIECGVWRGGTGIFLRAILKAYDVDDRIVWLADSFRGLPPPQPERYPHDANDKHHTYAELAVSRRAVEGHFERYGLLDQQVKFLEGWFCDTLPAAPVKRLALVRIDGDMYQSTMEALTHLYSRLSPGGYLIVDDYGAVPGCRQAVLDFRTAHRVREPLKAIDWTGVYWRRSR